MVGLGNGRVLSVAAYPVAWRIEIVNDDPHRGFEYVRLEHKVTHPTGTVTDVWISAFIGEPRTRFGIYRVVLEQGLDVEQYRGAITEQFHHPGAILRGYRPLSLVHLEVDPREG